ncbi:MAG: MucB/RseB C-terminal domain-containing protein [Piscinibacter sp.]|nr:MucB/RseB C-terminal domain-containing protein [Piscinibacter sp.]
MLIRSLFALTLLGAACGFVPALAGQGSAPSGPGGQEVRTWLLRIHEAAGKRNFQGTFVVSSGGTVSSARIAHFCVGTNQYERIESLDGQARHVFRYNDLVHTVWPASRVAVVERNQQPTAFPALLQAGDDHIGDFYDLQPQGAGRIAGHEADVLVVIPKDKMRYGFRLWSERSSGLLLRADVLAASGEVLESSAFSEVSIGIRAQPDSVLLPMRRLDGFRVVRSELEPTRLEDEGWVLSQAVPGFRLVNGVKRPMHAGTEAETAAPPVLQAIYSDGLTYVSLFIEAYDPQRHTREMRASLGATQTLMRRHGDAWVTLVGDVPPATLKFFANALERKK